MLSPSRYLKVKIFQQTSFLRRNNGAQVVQTETGAQVVWGGTLISSPRMHNSFWSFSLSDDALLNGAHLSWGVTLRKIVTVKPRAFTIENFFF